MKFTIEVVSGDGKITEQHVTEKFNQRFQEIKQRNPRGFLDQFEQQLELIAIEVAQELGGTVDIDGDSFLFNFTSYPNEAIRRTVEKIV